MGGFSAVCTVLEQGFCDHQFQAPVSERSYPFPFSFPVQLRNRKKDQSYQVAHCIHLSAGHRRRCFKKFPNLLRHNSVDIQSKMLIFTLPILNVERLSLLYYSIKVSLGRVELDGSRGRESTEKLQKIGFMFHFFYFFSFFSFSTFAFYSRH